MIKRQLQTVADISAIEAAKGLGCNVRLGDVIARAQQAALANGYVGNLSNAPNIVELGSVKTVAGNRKFFADSTMGSVHVVATRRVPSSLIARGFFNNDITLSAQAVSLSNVPIASFSVGTTALALNTKDSVLLNGLLGGMLGTSINLSLLSYQSLASTNITLANIIKVQGQALNVDELLALQLSSSELLALLSNAAGLSANAAPSAINDTLSLSQASLSNTKVSLGQILQVNQNTQAEALNVNLNVLNLVTAIVSLSNGQNAITIPVGVNLPGLASVNALVKIIEPPQVAIGPAADADGGICTVAKSAQVRVSLAVLVNLVVATVDLSLNVNAANGSAGLRTIEGNNNTTDVTFDASTSLFSIKLSNVSGTAPANISLLGIPLATIGLNLAPPNASSSAATIQIERPVKGNLPKMLSVTGSLSGSFEQLFSKSSALVVNVLGINFPVINTLVSSVVQPLLVQVSLSLLDPLLKLLGISAANMDIVVEDVILSNTNPLVI